MKRSQQFGLVLQTSSDVLGLFRTLYFTPAKMHQTLHLGEERDRSWQFCPELTAIPQVGEYTFWGPF